MSAGKPPNQFSDALVQNRNQQGQGWQLPLHGPFRRRRRGAYQESPKRILHPARRIALYGSRPGQRMGGMGQDVDPNSPHQSEGHHRGDGIQRRPSRATAGMTIARFSMNLSQEAARWVVLLYAR